MRAKEGENTRRHRQKMGEAWAKASKRPIRYPTTSVDGLTMFSRKVGSAEQTSLMPKSDSMSKLPYDRPLQRRASKLGLTATRAAALGLGIVVSGACATTAVTNAAANKPAKDAAGRSTKAKKPKAAKSTPTTITYRVPAKVGNGITPAGAKAPPAAAQTTAPAPAAVSSQAITGDCRLMPLGDSLTAFGESYRGPLYRTLKFEGLKIDFVGSGQWEPAGGGDPDGEGHGGFRIGPDDSADYQGKPANLDFYIADWLKSAKPHVILLTIGTNDLAAGGSIANAAAGKLQNLVSKIRELAPDAYLVVGDIPPNTNVTTISPPVKALDDVARKLGEGTDPKISYGNTARQLLDAGYSTAVHTSDGTHFTVEGGVLFAKAWYPKARAAIKAACGM